MCDPVTMTFAGIQALGQVTQGRVANTNAGTEADMLEFQGRQAMDEAEGEAQRIRRAGREARGETVAAIAASGVKVGEGSALEAERQVMTDYAQDEYLAILTGTRQKTAADLEASNVRRAGRDARRASKVQAFTSLLSAGAQSYRNSQMRLPRQREPRPLPGEDEAGFNGTNDRPRYVTGTAFDWWRRNGRSGD